VAESFGADAERYDRTRPSYPPELIARIVAASPGPEFVDVGCGTGIAARQFQAAGCRVLGVEVDPRMAERATGVEVEVAAFESWDVAGRAFDAVVSGQSWHWIDPVAGAAKAAEALRPGGRVAVFWNVFQPDPELAAAFAAVYRGVAHDLPFNPWEGSPLDAYTRILEATEAGLRTAFAEPERWRVDWERTYTRDEWLDQLPTHGGHSRLPPAQLDAVLAGVGDVVGDSFVMPYATITVSSSRA
jgi:SAM-dependent methyltransferase